MKKLILILAVMMMVPFMTFAGSIVVEGGKQSSFSGQKYGAISLEGQGPAFGYYQHARFKPVVPIELAPGLEMEFVVPNYVNIDILGAGGRFDLSNKVLFQMQAGLGQLRSVGKDEAVLHLGFHIVPIISKNTHFRFGWQRYSLLSALGKPRENDHDQSFVTAGLGFRF